VRKCVIHRTAACLRTYARACMRKSFSSLSQREGEKEEWGAAWLADARQGWSADGRTAIHAGSGGRVQCTRLHGRCLEPWEAFGARGRGSRTAESLNNAGSGLPAALVAIADTEGSPAS